MSGRHLKGPWLIAVLCAAQVLGMLANSTFPALIPTFQQIWSLNNTEAGWISGIYYAGYVAAVPVLVSLTDREDARLIYLVSTIMGGLAFSTVLTLLVLPVLYSLLSGRPRAAELAAPAARPA